MKEYPKRVQLGDGSAITLRPMQASDKDSLVRFFRSLPEEDRLFLKDDVTQEEVINRWVRELNYDRVLPILAEAEGEIVGNATLHLQPSGWASHVGEIRLVVARSYQRRGLGTVLAREIFHHAVLRGLEKLTALMTEDQVGARKAFERLGFKPEAVLHNHVKDLKGNHHNLLIMTNDVAALWKKIGDLILDSEFRMDH
jgi:RimJ/RimL family protein N-acetyltransferase